MSLSFFSALVIMHGASLGGIDRAWSTSTPMPWIFAAQAASRAPWPVSPAIWKMMSDALADDLLLGDRLALGRVVEALGRIRVGLLVEDLDVRLDRLGAVLVAAPVVDDGRDVRAADRADRAGLGQAGGDDAGEIARLGLGEDDALVVREQRGRVALAGEGRRPDAPFSSTQTPWSTPMNVMFGLALAAFAVSVPDQEADRHDDVVALVDEALDVRGVVGDCFVTITSCWPPIVVGRGLGAFVGRLVERLVLELTDVGDDDRP